MKVVASDTAKTESRIEERLVVLKQELARVEAELTAEEAKIPADFEDTYRRLVDSRAEEAFAPLDDKSCGGCNTGLTLKLIDQLRMGTPALCSSCGCLIYRPG